MGTLKFFPLQSSLHPGFWTVLAKTKLEVGSRHIGSTADLDHFVMVPDPQTEIYADPDVALLSIVRSCSRFFSGLRYV